MISIIYVNATHTHTYMFTRLTGHVCVSKSQTIYVASTDKVAINNTTLTG